MRLWWEVARRSFRRFSTYRAATLAGLFTNCVFGFMRGYVLLAVFEQRAEVGGFDRQQTVGYVWMTQGIIAVIGIWSWLDLGERVRSGAIASDLTRPLDLQLSYLAQDVGRATFHILTRGIPPVLLGGLLFDIRLPSDTVTWIAFALSIYLAVAVSFCVRFLFAVLAFWLLDDRGVALLYSVGTSFLSGFVVPITWMPGWMERTARMLPFAAQVQLPIEVGLGEHRGADLVATLAVQAAWVVVLLAVGRIVLRAGTRKLVVQGG